MLFLDDGDGGVYILPGVEFGYPQLGQNILAVKEHGKRLGLRQGVDAAFILKGQQGAGIKTLRHLRVSVKIQKVHRRVAHGEIDDLRLADLQSHIRPFSSQRGRK